MIPVAERIQTKLIEIANKEGDSNIIYLDLQQYKNKVVSYWICPTCGFIKLQAVSEPKTNDPVVRFYWMETVDSCSRCNLIAWAMPNLYELITCVIGFHKFCEK